jgi:hypothetical protein
MESRCLALHGAVEILADDGMFRGGLRDVGEEVHALLGFAHDSAVEESGFPIFGPVATWCCHNFLHLIVVRQQRASD